MTVEELASKIDLTLLRPEAGIKDIEAFAADAIGFPYAALCVPPVHVRLVSTILKGTGIRTCTVAGFPLGYNAEGIKLREAQASFSDGASEIDMVMNISLFRSGEYGAVRGEIEEVVKGLPGAVIKVIVEAFYLSDEEKIKACSIIRDSGAHFVKTSTGFAPGGARHEDVRLLAAAGGEVLKVKAAGGIRTLDDALLMLSSGASRIGASSAAIVGELAAKTAGR